MKFIKFLFSQPDILIPMIILYVIGSLLLSIGLGFVGGFVGMAAFVLVIWVLSR